MLDFTVEFFEYKPGQSYVNDYLQTVTPELREKILNKLDLLEALGNTAREPLSKPLDDGIFECRIKEKRDLARILFFFCIGRKIICTHGFTKKQQKTPKEEIERAKQIRLIYLKREEK